MIKLRKSEDRGFADHGWLKSRHTFSFADYYDPENIGYRTLRVINEDRIQGGTGFGAHPHRDMEIISYVVRGALEHEDSTGNRAVIRPGEVQRMSAGSGVVHSEQNAMPDQETHFFQIWIRPATAGGAAGYAQKSFEEPLNSGKPVLVISQDGREGSLPIKQDANMYIARMKNGDTLALPLQKGRGAWIQVVDGQISVAGEQLKAGDAVALEEVSTIDLKAQSESEILLFDLA